MSKVIDNIEDINAIDAKVAKVTSTDNAIARYDGTGGAIQNSSVYIDDSGNVGIGTSSPSNKLSVAGTSYFNVGTYATGYALTLAATTETSRTYQIGMATGAALAIYDANDAAERMRIDSYGNVGIGTSSPTMRLSVQNTRSNTAGTGFLAYTDSDTGAKRGLRTNTNNAWCFDYYNGSAWSEQMQLNSSGNIGIGTSSPSYKLHLSSDSAAKPSTNTWTISSDERLKENIELADLDRCYEIVKTIPLKRYTWKDSVYTQEQVSDRSKLGWIANDVQTVFPKAVNTHSQQLATFKIELKDVEEQKLISEAIIGQEEIKDEDGNIIQEFIEAKEAVYETITVQKEEKVYDVLDDCLDLNSDQIYAVMYGAIQKLQLTVESLTARIEALEAK